MSYDTIPNPDHYNVPDNGYSHQQLFAVVAGIALLGDGPNKIFAIRTVRLITASGLRESKDYVEACWDYMIKEGLM